VVQVGKDESSGLRKHNRGVINWQRKGLFVILKCRKTILGGIEGDTGLLSIETGLSFQRRRLGDISEGLESILPGLENEN